MVIFVLQGYRKFEKSVLNRLVNTLVGFGIGVTWNMPFSNTVFGPKLCDLVYAIQTCEECSPKLIKITTLKLAI